MDFPHGYYVLEINGVHYATNRPEMIGKINGPLTTEANICMSDEEIEQGLDLRIYLREC